MLPHNHLQWGVLVYFCPAYKAFFPYFDVCVCVWGVTIKLYTLYSQIVQRKIVSCTLLCSVMSCLYEYCQ